MEFKGLEERECSGLAQEIADFGVVLVAGDEDESLGEMRLNPFHAKEEHIAGEAGHEQIADHAVEVLGHDLAHSLDAIRDMGDRVPERFEIIR